MTTEELQELKIRLDEWAAEAGAQVEGGGEIGPRAKPVRVVRFRRLDQSWMVSADEFDGRMLAGENPFLPPFKDLDPGY